MKQANQKLLQITLAAHRPHRLWSLILDTLIRLLVRWRYVIRRIEQTEIVRLQMHLNNLCRHNWEVLHTGIVCKTVSMPDDNILVADILPGLNPGLDPCATQRLVCVFSCREELVVVIPGDPD